MTGEHLPAAASMPMKCSSEDADGKLATGIMWLGSGADGGAAEFCCDGFGSGVGNVGIAGSPLQAAGKADDGPTDKASTPKRLQVSPWSSEFFGSGVGTFLWVVVVGFWLSG